MAQHLINPHSFVSGKTPETTSVEYGEIAVNCNSNDPFLSIKVATSATATGKIEKFSPDSVLDEKYFSQSDGTSLTAEVSKKAPTNHASTSTTYGVATTSNYGHVKISNGDVATTATANGVAAGMDHTHSNYVTSSGSVAYATEAGSADSAASATTAESAGYATEAGHAETADSATSATTAGSAASATTAGSATNATNLTSAPSLISASTTTIKVKAGNKESSEFTVPYAAKAGTADSAAQATKLSTGDKGSATQPVYFDDGVPVACTYTLAKSVPSNAVFTDTNTWRPISDSVSGTDTGTSASQVAVKTAFDKASAAETLASEKADADHNHDSVYSKTGHTHSNYSVTSHTHDGRYYTESEMNTLLAAKSDSGHTHSNYSVTGHTHSYAGSASAGGSATSAVKLDTASAGSSTQPVYFSGGKPVACTAYSGASVNFANSAGQASKLSTGDEGSATQPVYFDDGVPVACTYTLAKSVPANAVFTDTNTWRDISDSVTSTSSTVGASSKAVKTAYDAAAAAQTTANGKWTYNASTIAGVKVNNAVNADTVGGKSASNFTNFYLSPMTANAPADSAKSWFTNTMPYGSGAIVYNVPGSEKTIIAGKSTGANGWGHMLQLNYDDNYLRLLRCYNGTWKTTDWEKISAGYADSAGSATDQTARNAAATAQNTANAAQTTANGKSTVSISRNLTSGTKVGTITINGTATDLYCQTNTDTDTKVTSAANHYTPASSTTLGFDSGDNYIKGLKLDSKGHITAVVTGTPKDTNTDTNTHYTTRIYAGESGTAANKAATNPYLKVTDDNTYRNQVRFVGGGATTISSDASGNITISSTDNNTDTKVTSAANHYTPTSSTTLGFDSGDNYIKGLKLDSKGHITAVVTGTPKDTNTDTDTHHTAYLRTGSATTSTANTTDTANGVYFNLVENGSVRSNTLVCGATNITVTSPTAGTIVITGPSLSNYSTTGHTHSGYVTTTGLNNFSAAVGETFVTGCVVTSASTATLVVDTPESTTNGNCYLKLLNGEGAQKDYVRFYGLGGCKCYSSNGTIIVSGATNTDSKVSATTVTSSIADTSMYILGHSSSGTSTANAYKTGMYMKGMASATTVHGVTGYYQDSDERLKTFHGEIPLDLEKLRKLPKAYFTWNGDEEGKMQIGTSAQKVRELYPEIVSGSDDTRLDVDYTKLAVIALRGIDVLYDELEKTRSEMETMKSELDVIKQKLGI